MKSSEFHVVAEAFARKAQTTCLRLAANGVRCAACFTVAIRPEVAAMRASFARAMAYRTIVAGRASGLAPARTSGLVAGATERAGTAPTEPAMSSWRDPNGGRR